MPKKTARRARSPRAISSAKQPLGLIVEGTISTRSARTESALDNRSHRTTGHDGHHRTVLVRQVVHLHWLAYSLCFCKQKRRDVDRVR